MTGPTIGEESGACMETKKGQSPPNPPLLDGGVGGEVLLTMIGG